MKLRELLQQMKKVQENIGSSEPYICGGTPRDRYMKRLDNISDLDITTGDKTVQYLAQELGSELSEKYNVTRRSHDDGHSSIYIGTFKMDFSSNFNVPNIDVILKNKGIVNPTEMQKEMFSRDFTCNALLLSLDLKNLIDPTKQGFKDIKDKVIRTCLDPKLTLTTNKNRVVRAIYLASKLNFDIDPAIIEFVQRNPTSVKISTEKAMAEKLNEAFNRDADRAAHYITKMNLWGEIPITEVIKPYYFKNVNAPQKKAYFQGGGGVNQPTPKEKKYKSDPALVMQPRFKEPLFKNYDLYETPGEHTPGGGFYQNMDKYDSVKDFIDKKRKRNKHKYKADDSWKQDDGTITKSPNGTKARADLFERIIKNARMPGMGLFHSLQRKFGPKATCLKKHVNEDSNSIDFPLDEYDEPGVGGLGGDSDNPVGNANLSGGYLDKYLPKDDVEDKPPTNLDFGRDYVEEETSNGVDIDKLIKKYLQPSTHGLYGLPDGVDLPDEDLGDPTEINPDYGTTDSGRAMYEDKWNI